MAVTVGAIGTEKFTSTDNAWNDLITTGAGDTALLIGVLDQTSSGSGINVVWDSGSTNQVPTQIGTVTDGTGTLYLFGLVNPAIGAKFLLINAVGGPTYVNAISFKGTLTSSDAACFTNVATNTGTSGTASVVVTSALGNMVAALHLCSSGGILSVNQTSWFVGGAGWAGNDANGAASVTLTATLGVSFPWASVGINLVAAVGTPPLNRQRDWPLPQRRRGRSVSLLTHTSPMALGYIERTVNSFTTWRPSYHAALNAWTGDFLRTQVLLPPGNYDWPVPRSRVRVLQDWQDSFNLGLQTVLPFNQDDWPPPMRARGRAPQDWMQPPSLALSTFVVVFPPNQTDWPNPQLPRPVITLGTWADSFKLPLQTVLPFSQEDWPNPRAPATVITQGTWTDSFKLGLQTVLPLNQSNWPLPPSQARRNPEDWQDYILPGAPETIPPVPPILMAQQWM